MTSLETSRWPHITSFQLHSYLIPTSSLPHSNLIGFLGRFGYLILTSSDFWLDLGTSFQPHSDLIYIPHFNLIVLAAWEDWPIWCHRQKCLTQGKRHQHRIGYDRNRPFNPLEPKNLYQQNQMTSFILAFSDLPVLLHYREGHIDESKNTMR